MRGGEQGTGIAGTHAGLRSALFDEVDGDPERYLRYEVSLDIPVFFQSFLHLKSVKERKVLDLKLVFSSHSCS